MNEYYQVQAPFKTELLDVGSGHKIFVEQVGNPQGQPTLVFHGGPGHAPGKSARQYFNPETTRLILFNQRGVGKSEYSDLLQDNTTQAIVSDAEKIREYLQIDKWHVIGGSWGSTLALLYAEQNPDKVVSLNLRGIFLGEAQSKDWDFVYGANQVFPEEYAKLQQVCDSLGVELTAANLTKIILEANSEKALQLAKVLAEYEHAIYKLISLPQIQEKIDSETQKANDIELLKASKIRMHFVKNDFFLKPGELLNNVDKIRNIPAVIIHGRYDMLCPFINAWRLHQVWPEATLEIVPDAGHHHADPGNGQMIKRYAAKFIAEQKP